jgi:hypothetical protein
MNEGFWCGIVVCLATSLHVMVKTKRKAVVVDRGLSVEVSGYLVCDVSKCKAFPVSIHVCLSTLERQSSSWQPQT